ncbi:MAG TPA: SOS response-associated peptidase family protein [Falsiroseomonas sp.]|nr:SOS response-associated peptidase family protein [Falsiroseomonas sp.]
MLRLRIGVTVVADMTLALAAIWSNETGGPVFAIVTTEATETLAVAHERMPALLPPALWARWLDERQLARTDLVLVDRPAPPAWLRARALPLQGEEGPPLSVAQQLQDWAPGCATRGTGAGHNPILWRSAMPWGEEPGQLPPMRMATGAALVRMAAEAKVHQVVGADELEWDPETQDAWHSFADLMREVADSAAEFDEADRTALADQVDAAIADLRRLRAKVVAGTGGGIMFVAVLPVGDRRDMRAMFASA